MSREEYEVFYQALLEAQKVAAHEFEQEKHFEGCMPVEALAERGPRTLTFGPLKPVGFVDPRTGRRPWAIMPVSYTHLDVYKRQPTPPPPKILIVFWCSTVDAASP